MLARSRPFICQQGWPIQPMVKDVSSMMKRHFSISSLSSGKHHDRHKPTTFYEINLDHIIENVHNISCHIHKNANNNVTIMPVIKANAYGHGATDVAVALLSHTTTKEYIRRFAVNRVAEGVHLRRELRHRLGDKIANAIPVLILGYILPGEMHQVAEFDLIPTITEQQTLNEYCQSVQQSGHTGKFHIKVDTGMGRFGLLPHEVIPFIKNCIVENAIVQQTSVQLEGMFTHFSVADELNDAEHVQFTRNQFKLFSDLRDQVSNHFLSTGKTTNQRIAPRDAFLFHCANSAAVCFYPEFHMDMVRPGVSIYGFSPRSVPHDPKLPFELKPALTFKSHLARVKTLPPHSSISYGRTFQTGDRELKVGLVPVGYGDGYHRLNSNRGYVLVNGNKAPICGRVCMDQFVVDLSACGDNVSVNDEVVLIGKQGDEEIVAEQLAAWSETINYEVTTSLMTRAPRIYRHS